MRKAYTIVEAMIVVAIMALVVFPAYKILSHGMKTTTKGVQRNKVIMDGQNILTQIKTDLLLACFPFENNTVKDVNSIMSVSYIDNDTEHQQIISVFTLNGLPYDVRVIPTTGGGMSYRRLNLIEYRLVSNDKTPFKRLERRVVANPEASSYTTPYKVISDHVNSFYIDSDTITSCGISRSFFKITLQLFDSENKSGHAAPFIADFMDTACPNLLNSILPAPGLNRNWYTDPSY